MREKGSDLGVRSSRLKSRNTRAPITKDQTLAVGCDLGGTNLQIAVLHNGRVRRRCQSSVPANAAAGDMAAWIAGEVRGILGAVQPSLRHSPNRSSPLPPRLGVAIPGFLDGDRRRVVRLSNLPRLDGYALADKLERRLRRHILGRVCLDADTNASALAEASIGAARKTRRALSIVLGTGVGAAMVVDGEIVRVSRHTVGQIAHIPLAEGGRRCACGNRGCAEALLSAQGIVARARAAGVTLEFRRTPKDVYEAAKSGNRPARRTISETGDLLGRLMGLLATILSPDRIVLGGGVGGGAAALLLPPARRRVERIARSQVEAGLDVVSGTLDEYAGAVGAALLAQRAATR